MKNVTWFLTALLLMTGTAVAQDVFSFRNIATGGTIDDNLDLVYDPIELRFVNGMHFYTNLSNLTSTREKLFNNVADNEFLIGVSMQNP